MAMAILTTIQSQLTQISTAVYPVQVLPVPVGGAAAGPASATASSSGRKHQLELNTVHNQAPETDLESLSDESDVDVDGKEVCLMVEDAGSAYNAIVMTVEDAEEKVRLYASTPAVSNFSASLYLLPPPPMHHLHTYYLVTCLCCLLYMPFLCVYSETHVWLARDLIVVNRYCRSSLQSCR